LKFTEPKFYK